MNKTKTKRVKIVATLAVIFLLTSTVIAFAQEPESQQGEAAKVLDEVKRKLNTKSESLTEVAGDISAIEENLTEATESIKTLEEQLISLEDKADKTADLIKRVQSEINTLNQRIKKRQDEVTRKKRELAHQKDLVSDLLQFLYVQNVNIGSFDSSLAQTMKLLFADEDVEDQLTGLYYLELVEVTSRDMFLKLETLKAELEENLKELRQEKAEQTRLKRELTKQQSVLEIQRRAKIDLLDETKGKEEIYKELLEQAKNTQVRVRQEVLALGKVYDELALRLDELDDGFADEELGARISDDKLTWPVDPTRGISAFFRDPSYKAALGVQHNAVDIRTPMQTRIKAAADGVVFKVKGGEGLDYHYVIIAHRNGILTLYGHMYDIYVEEESIVRKGQTIGLSGGLPGTRGAGYLTTGPHLHFEVFDKSKNVDPMLYLDLKGISQRYLPEKYLLLRK